MKAGVVVGVTTLMPGGPWPASFEWPLDGSVKSTIRLIISTWWGCTFCERQMQAARWIFKRCKGNKVSSNKFNTSGRPRWNRKTPASGAAACRFTMDKLETVNVCTCCMLWVVWASCLMSARMEWPVLSLLSKALTVHVSNVSRHALHQRT